MISLSDLPIFSEYYEGKVSLTERLGLSLKYLKNCDRKIKIMFKDKMKDYFTNDIDYKLFRRIPINGYTKVFYDENYVLIVYHRVIKRRDYYGDEEEVENNKGWLIGINDDNKLFCDYLGNHVIAFPTDINNLSEFVRGFLNYRFDYDGSYVYVDKGLVRIRVQGDLVFNIRKFDLEETKEFYREMCRDVLANHFINQISNFYLDKLIKKFSDDRISLINPNFSWGRIEFRIPITRIKWCDEFKFRRVIYELFKVYDEEIINENYDVLKYFSRYNPNIIIESAFGENFSEIRFRVVVDEFEMIGELSGVVDRLSKEFVDQLFDDIRYEEYTYIRGNHIIKAEILPHNVTYTFHNPIFDRVDRVNIRLAENRFITNRKVYVDHDEHKPVVVKFLNGDDVYYLIDVENIDTPNINNLVKNRIILREYIKKFNIKSESLFD